ncbi:MAG TPA: hypothetical protein PL185_00345 [Flavobacteriales bacterium]|nr:hypothetical protein [Flavobacteriales bacterium]HPH80989.1 hypothetical protein [Flavobacteriales bacterium]
MKVVIFNSNLLWPSHYETELELISTHLAHGDEVTQIYCDAQLPNCDLNPFFVPSVCDECVHFRKQGYQAISGDFTKIRLPELSEADKTRIAQLPLEFKSLEEIQALELDGFDLGYCVASSLISIIRDPKPDFKLYAPTIKSFITGSAAIFLIFKKWLIENKPDLVYTFNGRLAHTKPVLRACQQVGIECKIHERGSIKDKYSLTLNTSPHDRKYVKAKIIETWNQANPEERLPIAEDFYKSKFAGTDTNWYSYTKEQIDELPENWDPNKKNVVIFNSSEDEFASLGKEWKNVIYPSQADGIKQIAQELSNDSNVHFYLRVHPNLRKVDNADKKRLYGLAAPNLTIIPAESPISSYKLMMMASVVLTFGSSVGIEATYWGKVSILAGKTLYKGLGSTYEPESHSEVIELLRSELEPKDRTGALMFGYYYKSHGIPYKYYQPEDIANGTINGLRLVRTKNWKGKFKDWFFKTPALQFISERVYYKLRYERLRNYRND